MERSAPPDNVRLDGDAVVILDQTLLPNETKYIALRAPEELFEAIASLRVRGAPAIGIFAAYAIYVIMRGARAATYGDFLDEFLKYARYLNSARPTAVNLAKMLGRMEKLVKSRADWPIDAILAEMRREACDIQNEDIATCRAISEHGLALVGDGCGILTHCNAGPLATSRYGTALGPILLGRERGMRFRVYCDETRPLLQGARLTAYELVRAGVDTTLICDDMASLVMREGRIDAVFVGCDRVAQNGDAANKIGTSGLAILARYYKIPFYVFCPSSTVDFQCRTGADIEIELRSPEEITDLFFAKPVAPDGVRCYNPAFDVTESGLISAIVTEKGICRAPYTESLQILKE